MGYRAGLAVGLCWRAGGPGGSAEGRGESSEPASVPGFQPVQRNPNSCVTRRHFYQRPSRVCVCAYRCADVYKHTCALVSVCTHGHACSCVGACLRPHMCTCVFMCAVMGTQLGRHRSAHTRLRMHMYMHTQACVWLCVQVYVFVVIT